MKSKRFIAALCATAITLTAVTSAEAQQRGVAPAPASPTALTSPMMTPATPSWPDEGSIAGPPPSCPRVVLANNNFVFQSTAPNTNAAFQRGVYLITATELAAAGYTNGATPTSIGWRYNPGLAGTAPLIVYMENTADTTNLKSTTWATAISTMTMVHNGTYPVPAAASSVDVTFTGGSPFTYTGGGIYIAYDWGQFTGTTSTANRIFVVNTGLTLFATNAAAPPATMGSIAARPETRLNGVLLLNDATVSHIYSLGALPGCAVPAQVLKAVVVNNGADTLTNLQVTLNVTGANTFTDTQTIASLAGCGANSIVTFLAYTPSNLGTDTVTVSVPTDNVPANNSLNRPTNVNQTEYSYKYPGSTASGGAGFTGGTGAVVAKFTTTLAETITDVKLEFFGASATTYRVAIYPESGTTPGTPGTTALYVDAVDRTVAAAGPTTITLPAPVAVGPGVFFVGIHQTNTTNANMSFDNESPARSGTFFFSAPLPPATWTDFAAATPFKINVGYLGTACNNPVCPGNTDGNNAVDVLDLLAVINNWGACDPPCPPTPCPADVASPANCAVDVLDLLQVINAWGPCP